MVGGRDGGGSLKGLKEPCETKERRREEKSPSPFVRRDCQSKQSPSLPLSLFPPPPKSDLRLRLRLHLRGRRRSERTNERSFSSILRFRTKSFSSPLSPLLSKLDRKRGRSNEQRKEEKEEEEVGEKGIVRSQSGWSEKAREEKGGTLREEVELDLLFASLPPSLFLLTPFSPCLFSLLKLNTAPPSGLPPPFLPSLACHWKTKPPLPPSLPPFFLAHNFWRKGRRGKGPTSANFTTEGRGSFSSSSSSSSASSLFCLLRCTELVGRSKGRGR